MDFRELNFRGTQMPIIVVEEGIVEYNYCYCNFNVILPFNQEDYDRIQKVPYVLYFPQEEKYLVVEYQSGIEIPISIEANFKMIIHDVEGHIIIGSVNDSKPYSYSDKYERELLGNENVLRLLDSKEEESKEWSVSWDTGKESQDDIISW